MKCITFVGLALVAVASAQSSDSTASVASDSSAASSAASTTSEASTSSEVSTSSEASTSSTGSVSSTAASSSAATSSSTTPTPTAPAPVWNGPIPVSQIGDGQIQAPHGTPVDPPVESTSTVTVCVPKVFTVTANICPNVPYPTTPIEVSVGSIPGFPGPSIPPFSIIFTGMPPLPVPVIATAGTPPPGAPTAGAKSSSLSPSRRLTTYYPSKSATSAASSASSSASANSTSSGANSASSAASTGIESGTPVSTTTGSQATMTVAAEAGGKSVAYGLLALGLGAALL